MKTKVYYSATNLAGEKETGPIFPQCYDFIRGVDGDAPHSFFDLEECVKRMQIFPYYKPLLDGLKFASRAKPTDFLSTAPLENVISKMGIKALRKLNFTEHRIYPMKIFFRKNPILYFHVPFLKYGSENIIWNKCEFYKTDIAFKTANIDSIYIKKLSDDFLSFNSYDDYMSYCKSVPYFLELSKLAVNESFDLNLDHFKSSVTIYQYVSERFIETYMDRHLTGLKFDRKIVVEQE